MELPVLGPPEVYPTPEEPVHGNFFADKDNVIASFVSNSYYESFMQLLETLFHAFVMKNGLCFRETKPLGKLFSCSLLLKEQH